MLRVVRVGNLYGQYHRHNLANNVGMVKLTMDIGGQVKE